MRPRNVALGVLFALLVFGIGWPTGATGQDAPYDLAPPPRMVLRAETGGEQRGGDGTFCWDEGCADFIGVQIPDRPLVVAAGAEIELDLGALGRANDVRYWVYADDAVEEQDGERWILYGRAIPIAEGELANGKTVPFAVDLPPGHYAVEIVAQFRRGGDSTQGFNLIVEPPAAASPVAAAATPAATPATR